MKEYLRETSETDGYTMDWSDPEEESIAVSYFVEHFAEATEMDFNFSVPITELLNPPSIELLGEGTDQKQGQVEDRSLGEVDVPLSSK